MEPGFAVGQLRWVFEDYVVYASDRDLAEQIHDRLRSEHGARDVFGMEELPAGTGYWVRIVSKQ
jgi:hypothetical protein